MIARHVSALRISRTSCVLAIVRHLPPFAMWPVFPTADYYEGSVAVGLAPSRRSHVLGHPLKQRDVGAPFRSLRSLIGFRPSAESSGGDNENRRKPMAPPSVVAGECVAHRWSLEFKQCSLRPITRALPRTAVHAFEPSRRFQQAVVPSAFRLRVSWLAQGQSSRAPLD